jgi:hypothetical protein
MTKPVVDGPRCRARPEEDVLIEKPHEIFERETDGKLQVVAVKRILVAKFDLPCTAPQAGRADSTGSSASIAELVSKKRGGLDLAIGADSSKVDVRGEVIEVRPEPHQVRELHGFYQ